LSHLAVGQQTKVIAAVKGIRRINTRANRMMAIMEIEDLTERVEVVLFPDVYDEYGFGLEIDDIIEVTGRVDRRNDQIQIVCERVSTDVKPIDPDPPSRLVRILLNPTSDYWKDVEVLQRLDLLLSEHVGHDRIEFEVPLNGKHVRVAASKHRVEWDDALAEQIRNTVQNARITVDIPDVA
jgi:DNA polymerase-3 subunit alpha